MMVALDTNRYRDFCEGVEEAVHVLRSAERRWMPFPGSAELDVFRWSSVPLTRQRHDFGGGPLFTE